METVVILLMGLLVLDAVAWRWGFDSRDGWNSAEWNSGGVGMPFTSPSIAALANIKEEMKDMIV